jgi:hypothetical protein
MQLALDAGSVSVDDVWEIEETTRTVRPPLSRLMRAPEASYEAARVFSRPTIAASTERPPPGVTFATGPSDTPATAPTSYAPTSASLPPRRSAIPPPPRRSLAWLTFLPAAAAVAIAASFATTLALRSRHPDGLGAAMGSPPSGTIMNATAPTIVTLTPIATTATPTETETTIVARPKAKIPQPQRAKPRIIVAVEPSATPSVDPTPAASSAVPVASTVPKSLHDPKLASTVGGSKPDEFGGRE